MDSAEAHLEASRYKWLIVILSLIPTAILIFFLFKYRVEAPVAMQWELVPLLDKAYSGKLTLRDLWELHNEHRPIFSRALLIFLAQLTHWSVLYELLANFVCASITFFALLYLLKKTQSEFNKSLLSLVPVISLVIFSLNQSENWFGGFNIQIFMNVAAVTLGLTILGTSSGPNWLGTTTAAALGIVATYTFANGVLFWPLGIWILWNKVKLNGMGWKLIAFWIVVSSISLLFYFPGYQKPPHHPSPWSFLQEPLQALNYIFAYLGAPLFAFCKKTQSVAEWLVQRGLTPPRSFLWFFQNVVSFAGIAGVGVFFYVYYRVEQFRKNGILITFFALSAYAFLSALLSAFGRSAMGIENALSLRYVTISSLFWISLLVLLKLVSSIPATERDHKPKWMSVSTGVIIFFLVVNSVYGALYAVKLHSFLTPARQELYRMKDDELLQRLHSDVDWIRRSVPIMKKYGLSLFKEEKKN